MARVLALCADLMFGSRIAAQLQGVNEQLELLPDAASVGARLQGPAEQRPEVLVVDLTSDSEDGIELVARLAGDGEGPTGRAAGSPRTLGFYSHVEADVRERAERAGFDLVVPRSRMAREGAALVERLLEGPAPRAPVA
jgi:CheY-like chemotaxis protein